MAIAATTVWEVRTTGSDSACGGGFDSSLGGTDYSQQNSAQATGTVTSASTTVTATTGIFTAAMVGNIITDGTTYKEITAYTSSLIVTVDSAPSWTAATIYVGGSLATPSKAFSIAVASNLIWIKQGSYTVSSNPTINPSGVTPQSGTNFNRIFGYSSIRGDNPAGSSRPTLTASGSTTTILPIAVSGFWVDGLILDCNSVANVGMSMGGNWCSSHRVTAKNFLQYGISVTGASISINTAEATGGITGATCGINLAGAGQSLITSNVHDNVCTGAKVGTNGGYGNVAVGNTVTNNAGASSDGIQFGYNSTILENSVYGSGRDGIRNVQAFNIATIIQRNILVSNGGYGLNFSGGSVVASSDYDNNAYYGNTSGTRNNCGTGTTDVILTGSPFTNAGSGDFSLNNTVGAGAACRAAALPGVFPGGTTTGYPDLGAVQSQATSGGGLLVNSGMTGGMRG
jgi:hypothetical protein